MSNESYSDPIPSTYMERFCSSIDPKLDWSMVCVTWFLHATNHCAELINNKKRQGHFFWKATMMGFIFPEQPTELMSLEHPLRIHPNGLTLHDCEFLYQNIVNDYVMKAHRFPAESMINTILFQIFYWLMIFIFLGCMVFGVIKLYNRYGYIKQTGPDALDPQICREKVVSRSLRMAKEEVSRLKVLSVTNPEDLIAADGTAIMVIKANSKFEFVDSAVTGSVATKSRLYRLHDPYGKIKTDYKLQSVKNVFKFVGNALKKLRVLIVFEEDPLANDSAEKKVYSGDFGSGNSTGSSAGDSPRNANKKALPKSNRPISPQNQTLISPRSSPKSGLSQASGIPHNVGRRSPTNKK